MFVAIYWWRVAPGKEEQFRRAWSRGTDLIRRRYGGLGSRLHATADGRFVGYAEWPDEATWRAAFDQRMAYDEPETRAAFLDAVIETPPDADPIFAMPVVEDRLTRRRRPFDLTGRTALVTGAGRGLGAAIARGLGLAGARVILHGRDAAQLAAAADRLDRDGIVVDTLAFDLADETAMRNALDGAIDRIVPIDILVNNAGGRDRRPIEDLDRTALRHLLEVNLVAPFDLCRTLAPTMGDGGRIINVTSIAGTIARAGDAGYTASKGALEALTRALAAELGPRGITVNAVAPGYFATEANSAMVDDTATAEHLSRRTALGRWGRPEEIAGAVTFLASAEASYVTGQVLAVDGGYLAHF